MLEVPRSTTTTERRKVRFRWNQSRALVLVRIRIRTCADDDAGKLYDDDGGVQRV